MHIYIRTYISSLKNTFFKINLLAYMLVLDHMYFICWQCSRHSSGMFSFSGLPASALRNSELSQCLWNCCVLFHWLRVALAALCALWRPADWEALSCSWLLPVRASLLQPVPRQNQVLSSPLISDSNFFLSCQSHSPEHVPRVTVSGQNWLLVLAPGCI